jgi:hypothetical protein
MAIRFSELVSKLPSKLFEEVEAEYKVDRANHKLTGRSMFQMLLYNICEEDRISLRVIEESFERHQFSLYHKGKELKASKSGISDRLRNIDYRYYEAIFGKLRTKFAKEIPAIENSNIKLFDSTLITLSSKLLKCGFKTSTGFKQQVKFSVGFDGLPCSVRFGDKSSDNSEDVALKAAIKEASLSKEDIVVFDRGISGRKTLQEFKQMGVRFVTRLNDKANYKIIKDRGLIIRATGELELVGDYIVHLRSKDIHWIKEEFRLIQAINKAGKEIIFLTNLTELTAAEVAEIYKMRWDIEVFFKFIKQHLNTKHFLSRNINGIKVVFYMILISALMILTFKKLNKIDSFTLAKKRFVEQLRRAITYDIILLYRHNPSQFKSSFTF